MAGYIGKISAVVTANTSMLSRELVKSAKDADKFARSLRNSINRGADSASASIEKIFTPLQALERKLQQAASRSLNLNMPSDKIRALVSAAEQINKPLEAASGSFQKLSAGVQSGFAPALARAQSQAEALFKIIEVGRAPAEAYFGVVESRVERTTQSLQRLAQAQQAASRGFSGNELQFTNPAAFAALGRNAAATRAAAELSPEAMSFDRTGLIRDQVKSVARAQSLIERAAAKVESLRLLPDVDSASLANAEKRLSSLVALSGEYRKLLLNSVEAANEAANAEQLRAKAAEDATKTLIEREKAAKRIEQSLAAAEEDRKKKARQAQDEEIRKLIERERTAKKVEQNLASAEDDRSKKAKQAQDEDIKKLIERERTAKKVEQNLAASAESRRKKARQAEDEEIKALIKKEQLNKKIEQERFQSGLATRFDPSGRSISQRLIEIDFARRGKEGRELAAARRAQSKDFIGVTGGKSLASLNAAFDKNAIRGYTEQLRILQQTIGGVSAEARGPAIGAFNRLRSAIAKAMNDGELETDQTRAKIKQLTAEAVAATAKVAGVSRGALGTRLKRAGSVATGSFGNASLAIQQAAFAVDDFFSVTGGLDQRIRAVGNNLSQLGFIVGGTAGLITGISLSIGSQAVVAFLKWINAIEDTEEAQKRLDARLSALNSSLEDQRSSVQSLADAYERLRESASSALSETERNRRGNNAEIEEIVSAQSERRAAAIANVDPTIIARRSEIEAIDRQVQQSQDPTERAELLRQRQNAQDSIDYRRRVIESQGRRLSRELSQQEIEDELRQASAAAQDVRTRTFEDTPEGRSLRRSSIRSADERLAVATAAQTIERDPTARVAAGLLQTIRDALEPSQRRAASIEGSQGVSDAIDAIVTRAQTLFERASEGDAGALGELQLRASEAGDVAKQAEFFLSRAEEANRGDELRRQAAPLAELQQVISDLRASFNREAASSANPARVLAERDAEVSRVVREKFDQESRQRGPAVLGLQEQAANAALAGPSRAALQVSDITNQRGTAEFLRLLRGEDPARDQNLVELRRQTEELVGLRRDFNAMGVAP